MISHQVSQEISFDRYVEKKSESGIGRADIQGKIKSTACVLFINIPGRHGKHPHVSARCKCWVGGRAVGLG